MAKKKKNNNLIGSWAFLIGVILAFIFAFITMNNAVAWTLVILGIIIGLINISVKEGSPFMLAGTVFVIVSYFGMTVFPGVWIPAFLNRMLMLFVPATIVVALKAVFSLAKD